MKQWLKEYKTGQEVSVWVKSRGWMNSTVIDIQDKSLIVEVGYDGSYVRIEQPCDIK